MDFNETDNVVRILTIVSNALVSSKTFDNADIDVEFVCVASVLDAMKQLDEWAKQGKAADIVDIEHFPPFLPMRETSKEEMQQCEAFKKYYGTEDYTGVEVVSFFNDWSKLQKDKLQIGKFFLNSLTPEDLSEDKLSRQLGVPLSVHHVMEYNAMFQHAKHGCNAQDLGVNDYTMREYLNNRFGSYYQLDDLDYHQDNILAPEL